MRDALLRITNDGDFQHCGVEECYIEVEWLLPNGRRLTHHAQVSPCKAIEDLFAN